MRVPHPFLWIFTLIFGLTVLQKLRSTTDILESVLWVLALIGLTGFVAFAVLYLEELDQQLLKRKYGHE